MRNFNVLDTPAVVVDEVKFKKNVADMAEFSRSARVALRPHLKSHKTVEIALLQLGLGAAGVTVAKLGEAEEMVKAGIEDVFIANQLFGEQKLARLTKLLKMANLTVAADSMEGAAFLASAARAAGKKIKVLIEINTGLNRCGVLPGDACTTLVKKLMQVPELDFKGIFTHAGHVYGSASEEEVKRIARQEGEVMVQLARGLEGAGIPVEVVSVGSTPTVKVSGKVEGVTEIRPGNYVFYDAIQVGLGVVPQDRCALSILTRVISKPAGDRIVVDAGSKTFSMDKGAHGKQIVEGFGIIKGYPNLRLNRLSEEHGIVEVLSSEKLPETGDTLTIIPNHACPVVNLTDSLTVITETQQLKQWPVVARGRVQ